MSYVNPSVWLTLDCCLLTHGCGPPSRLGKCEDVPYPQYISWYVLGLTSGRRICLKMFWSLLRSPFGSSASGVFFDVF